mmetsp:Transcript_109704/g.318912  ORF Transcript_109704/g.318912 Transcript_109704/m.318912 type:complete len:1128 (-) Transcript_109704:1780-5163(-)
MSQSNHHSQAPEQGLLDNLSMPWDADAGSDHAKETTATSKGIADSSTPAVAARWTDRGDGAGTRPGTGAAGTKKRSANGITVGGSQRAIESRSRERDSAASPKGWVNRKNVLISGLTIYVGIPLLVILANAHDDSMLFYLMQIGGAIWGMLCVLVIFWSAHMVPRFKRHPNKIMLWRSACSLGIALKLIITEILLEAECASWNDGESSVRFGSLQDCKNRRYCTMCNVDEWPAFFLNFFFMAGECWFFCQAMDLYFSLKNPFYSFKGRIVTYHAFVWIFALLDSLVPWLLDLTNKDKHWFDIYGFSEGQGAQINDKMIAHNAGNQATNGECRWAVNKTTNVTESCKYVNDVDLICWFNQAIKDDNHAGIKWNVDQFGRSLIFWIPILVFSTSAIVCLYKAYQRLNDGLSFTFVARLRVFAVNFTQILCYSSWWIIYFLLDLSPYAMGNCSQLAKYIYALRYYMIASRGYIDLLAWFTANDPARLARSLKKRKSKGKSKRAAIRDMDRDLQPQVNLALRSEVLHYITSGIRTSIEMAHPDDFVEELDRYRSSTAPGAGGSIASGSGPGPRTPQRRSEVGGPGGLGGSVFTPVPVDSPHSHLTQQLRVARSGVKSGAADVLDSDSTPAACHSHKPNTDYTGSNIISGAENYRQHPINMIREDPHWQRERDSSYTGPRTFASSSSNRDGLSALEANSSASTNYVADPPADSTEQNPWSAAASRIIFSARGKGNMNGRSQSDERSNMNPPDSSAPPGSNFVGWSLKRLKVGHLGKIGFGKLLQIAMDDKAINELTERMRRSARTESRTDNSPSTTAEDAASDSDPIGGTAAVRDQDRTRSDDSYDSLGGAHAVGTTTTVAATVAATAGRAYPHEASRPELSQEGQAANMQRSVLPPFATGASGLGEDEYRRDGSLAGDDSGESALRARESGADSDGEAEHKRSDSDEGPGSHGGSFDDGVYRPEGRSGSGYRSNSSEQQHWSPINPEDLEAALYGDDKKSRVSSLRESLLPSGRGGSRMTRVGRGNGRSGSLNRVSYSSVGSLVVQPQQRTENEVVLLEFEPDSFRRVREHFGITPRSYHEAFKKTAKERLTEGGEYSVRARWLREEGSAGRGGTLRRRHARPLEFPTHAP